MTTKKQITKKGLKNYTPATQSFADGFKGPKFNEGYDMYYDSNKAMSIIHKINVKDIKQVEAGLDGDWDCNSCTIYDSDGFHDYDVYEHSCWAKPIMRIEYKDGHTESFEVWRKSKQ